MKKVFGKTVLALAFFFLIVVSTAWAGGFQGYEGGVIQLKQPNYVYIHKTRTDYRIIAVGGFCRQVVDARWYGDDLAVTWIDKQGREHIYLYKTRTSYKVMK